MNLKNVGSVALSLVAVACIALGVGYNASTLGSDAAKVDAAQEPPSINATAQPETPPVQEAAPSETTSAEAKEVAQQEAAPPTTEAQESRQDDETKFQWPWKTILSLIVSGVACFFKDVRQGLYSLFVDCAVKRLTRYAMTIWRKVVEFLKRGPQAPKTASPSPKLSAAPSVAADRSFLAFLNDLPDASRLAFVYATASSEKRIDFYRDDARQEFIVSHRLHGKVKPVFFKLPAKEYRELLANIQDAEKQGFIAKQRLKSRDGNDEDYVIQASCERKSLQCFIDDELRKEFAKFPSLVWTVLEAVCAAPDRMLGIDESDRVRLFRGCYVGDELDAPSLEKAPRKDLEDAVCFLIAREGLEKRARFDSLSFYAPLNQSYLLDELRRERFSNAPPFRKPSRKFWRFWRRKH